MGGRAGGGGLAASTAASTEASAEEGYRPSGRHPICQADAAVPLIPPHPNPHCIGPAILCRCCAPLRAFIYTDGLARFCTEPYQAPAAGNLGNAYAHLSNYAVNKSNPAFVFNTCASDGWVAALPCFWLCPWPAAVHGKCPRPAPSSGPPPSAALRCAALLSCCLQGRAGGGGGQQVDPGRICRLHSQRGARLGGAVGRHPKHFSKIPDQRAAHAAVPGGGWAAGCSTRFDGQGGQLAVGDGQRAALEAGIRWQHPAASCDWMNPAPAAICPIVALPPVLPACTAWPACSTTAPPSPTMTASPASSCLATTY
jgi:hypothetical protein